MVTKKVLELYDKYDGDFSLLYEPWAEQNDRAIVSPEQAQILGSYIEKLEFLKLDNISTELQNRTISEIKKLELQIEEEVIAIVKGRINTKH